MTIIKSYDVNKISLHISTFGMKLLLITKVAVFTELICKKLSEELQTEEYVHIKKPVYLNNGTTIDFMLYLFDNESEVKDSSLLGILKTEITSCSSVSSITAKVELELEIVEKLL
ncbi:hypothetical protein C1645_826591 [Glomus cerebriforme]|uniref:Uncharacterized protein n=1 Tax=Glomus cerebriforme TaxID=658196 RepID=A0A397SWV0_9GLOM|nr:hypothetical protein C1645_826591 [Glomus cerebriforme]